MVSFVFYGVILSFSVCDHQDIDGNLFCVNTIVVLNFQGPAKVQLAKPKEFLAKHSKEKIIPEGTQIL
jgi:hypothetical protein